MIYISIRSLVLKTLLFIYSVNKKKYIDTHEYLKRIYTHTDRFQGEKLQLASSNLFDACSSCKQNQIADIYAYIKQIYTY